MLAHSKEVGRPLLRQSRSIGCNRLGSSTSASSSQVNTDHNSGSESTDQYKNWFTERVSSTIPRTYQYEPMSHSPPVDPDTIVELDHMSMCGLKAFELPLDIQKKVFTLLEQFGYKGDLERFGKYLVARYRSRACAEVPKVLSSSLVPERSMRTNQTPLERLLGSHGFADLKNAMPEFFNDEAAANLSSSLAQAALSNAEDQKHKIYQMFYSPGTAVTYLAHRFPSTFAANFRVMLEVFKRAPDFNPVRILDYGAGMGVSSLAALQVWQNASERTITCVEPSQNMQQVGKYLLADSEATVNWQAALYGVKEREFDMIVASYVLMEIKDQDSRDLLIENLFNKLAPGGVLIVLDCGTPTGFRYIHRIREQFTVNQIRKEFSPSHGEEKEWHILAPCPHESVCPLAQTGKDWCHFDQRVRRLPHSVYEKGKKKNNTDFEKFSYLVIRKSQGPRDKYSSAAEAPTSWEKSFFWPRIVMPAIKSGGHTLIDVCARPNNFERLVVSKAKPHGFGYRFSRKVMWGDLWRYPKRLARKDARESYTPDQVKTHMQKLRDEAKKAGDEISNHTEGQKLEEVFYAYRMPRGYDDYLMGSLCQSDSDGEEVPTITESTPMRRPSLSEAMPKIPIRLEGCGVVVNLKAGPHVRWTKILAKWTGSFPNPSAAPMAWPVVIAPGGAQNERFPLKSLQESISRSIGPELLTRIMDQDPALVVTIGSSLESPVDPEPTLDDVTPPSMSELNIPAPPVPTADDEVKPPPPLTTSSSEPIQNNAVESRTVKLKIDSDLTKKPMKLNVSSGCLMTRLLKKWVAASLIDPSTGEGVLLEVNGVVVDMDKSVGEVFPSSEGDVRYTIVARHASKKARLAEEAPVKTARATTPAKRIAEDSTLKTKTPSKSQRRASPAKASESAREHEDVSADKEMMSQQSAQLEYWAQFKSSVSDDIKPFLDHHTDNDDGPAADDNGGDEDDEIALAIALSLSEGLN